MMRLLTIPMSHYCEKARWALERHCVDYVEIRHLQGFHYLPSLARGGGTLLPVLLTPDGVVRDSTRILEYLDARASSSSRLAPNDDAVRTRVTELEDRFDEGLGIASRLLVYEAYLDHPELLLPIAGHGAPSWQRTVAPWVFPLMRAFVKRRLRVSADSAERARRIVRECFDDVSKLLAQGNRFLLGDRFTAADLTFACMAAPVLLPPEYGIPLPRVDELVPTLRPFVEELRATDAGRFALRLFAEERRRPEKALEAPEHDTDAAASAR